LKDRYFELKNLIGAILLLSVVVWGCQKGDQTLGINMLPGVKILFTGFSKDSTSITTSIFTDTKIRADRPTLNLLGSFNDPVFGRTDASFAAQFRLPYHPAYSASAALDSIILRMTYKKIYGDTVSSQSFKVYELTGDLNYSAKYLSSFDLKSLASLAPIGTGSYIPKFRTDSTKTDTTEQIIRVRLNTSFGNSLLGIDSLKMTSNDEFLKYFKGLYIGSTPISRKGTLVSVNASASMIVLYYHDSKKDTLGYAYRVTANSANVSSYVHDYTLARFKPNLDKENNLDTLIYIQPTGGIKSKILVPTLSNWNSSANYAINKATLTFHADTIMSDYRRYSMPSRLYLILSERDSNGDEVFPADSGLSSSYYGGFYNASNATYSFNVTQHLQKLIDGKLTNTGFYLVSSERNISAQRVVLKGLGSSKPVELNVTYTRYK
jgi:hypothetical protein